MKSKLSWDSTWRKSKLSWDLLSEVKVDSGNFLAIWEESGTVLVLSSVKDIEVFAGSGTSSWGTWSSWSNWGSWSSWSDWLFLS